MNPSVSGTGALLKTPDGQFLFQERDHHTTVYPGRITPFGGAIEGSESAVECAIRELKEELELVVSAGDLIDLGVFKSEIYIQMFLITDVALRSLVLHEGKAIRKMGLDEALNEPLVTDFTKEVLRSLSGPKV